MRCVHCGAIRSEDEVRKIIDENGRIRDELSEAHKSLRMLRLRARLAVEHEDEVNRRFMEAAQEQ